MNQLWIFSFLTGAELASVHIGSVRVAPYEGLITQRDEDRPGLSEPAEYALDS